MGCPPTPPPLVYVLSSSEESPGCNTGALFRYPLVAGPQAMQGRGLVAAGVATHFATQLPREGEMERWVLATLFASGSLQRSRGRG
jgi:hypothetical protein